MVGRLVQQQDVRVSEERLRQEDLDLVVAVELGHLLAMLFLVDAELVEHGLGVAFGVPAVHLGKLALQLRGAQAVLVGEVRLCVERLLFLHDLVEALIAHDDGGEHVVFIVEEVVLLEDRDALARGDDDLARVRLQLPGENFQELALARAVCADDAVAVALVKLDVHVFKKNPLPKLERNIACLYHFLFLSDRCFPCSRG